LVTVVWRLGVTNRRKATAREAYPSSLPGRKPFARAVSTVDEPSHSRDPGLATGHVPRGPVFEVHATEQAARAGLLRTAHGTIETPVFMPVGTKATVKTLDPDEVRALGAQILLGNAYHLHFRPGAELIRDLGGLHRFMGWPSPILTDSGGFQVFSLRDTIVRVDDEAVTFRNVYDGRATQFTPELAARIQRDLGSDIAMCLDQVPPSAVTRRELEAAVRRNTIRASRPR